MTAEEVCVKYNITLSTLKNNFNRTATAILKKHKIRLIKKGRGDKATYIEVQDDERALTMFDENREIFFLDQDSMSLAIWECNILLAIILCPMLVFRGSYEEMLDYMCIKSTAANLGALKIALQELENKGWIHYYIDKTDNNYFVGALYRAVEQKYGLGINNLKISKKLADENNMQSYIPLLKVLTTVQYYDRERREGREDGICTTQMICDSTGLNRQMVDKCQKILKANDIYISEIVYKTPTRRLGQRVTLNEFHNDIIDYINPDEDGNI